MRLGDETKSLVQSFPTCWNSGYYMVDILIQYKEAMCAELAELKAFENLTGNEGKLTSGYQTVLGPCE